MALTTSQLLASHGVTLQQAHDWVMARLATPQAIADVARAFGITNAQLGEIAGGYSGAQVQAFFGARGIDTSALDAAAPQQASVLPSSLSALSVLVTPDTYTGALSVASLHTRVAASTGATAYANAFGDTTFESQFYGTLINAMKAVDVSEAAQLVSFAQSHSTGMSADPLGTLGQASDLLVSIFTTAARLPVFSDSVVADAAVAAGTYYVQMIGQGHANAGAEALLAGFFH